jgi:hypothetical protein
VYHPASLEETPSLRYYTPSDNFLPCLEISMCGLTALRARMADPVISSFESATEVFRIHFKAFMPLGDPNDSYGTEDGPFPVFARFTLDRCIIGSDLYASYHPFLIANEGFGIKTDHEHQPIPNSFAIKRRIRGIAIPAPKHQSDSWPLHPFRRRQLP